MNDSNITIAQLVERIQSLCEQKNGHPDPQQTVLSMNAEMSELLGHYPWLTREDVQWLRENGNPERRAEIADELSSLMLYALELSRQLDIDLAKEILRKLDDAGHRTLKPIKPER